MEQDLERKSEELQAKRALYTRAVAACEELIREKDEAEAEYANVRIKASRQYMLIKKHTLREQQRLRIEQVLAVCISKKSHT